MPAPVRHLGKGTGSPQVFDGALVFQTDQWCIRFTLKVEVEEESLTQDYPPHLASLPITDNQHPILWVNISNLQTQGFTDTQAAVRTEQDE